MAIQQETKPLTALDLIAALKKLDPETVVLLSSDAEGNGIHEFEGIDVKARWDVNRKDLALKPDYSGYAAFNPKRGIRKAVVLYPKHGW